MFRIITEFVPQASFLLLCDSRHCACAATAKVEPGATAEEIHQAVTPFLQDALRAGWVIGVDQHICPQHARRLEEGRRLVEVPQFRFN